MNILIIRNRNHKYLQVRLGLLRLELQFWVIFLSNHKNFPDYDLWWVGYKNAKLKISVTLY